MINRIKPLCFLMGLFLFQGCAEQQMQIAEIREDIYKSVFVSFAYEAETEDIIGGKLNGISLPKPYIKLFNGGNNEKEKLFRFDENCRLFNSCCDFLECIGSNSNERDRFNFHRRQ